MDFGEWLLCDELFGDLGWVFDDIGEDFDEIGFCGGVEICEWNFGYEF